VHGLSESCKSVTENAPGYISALAFSIHQCYINEKQGWRGGRKNEHCGFDGDFGKP
jgi:hypothetical protein